jgi:hypothetical protein
MAPVLIKGQKELDLQSPPPSKRTLEVIDSIFELLRPATSLAVVSDFLKAKNLRFSAVSWEEMKVKRVIPAIRQQKITLADLKRLLSEAEEFGRTHIFLYRSTADRVAKFFDEDHLRSVVKRNGKENLLGEPEVVTLPDEPTLTEIRRDDQKGNKLLNFKIIESRDEHVLEKQKTEENRIFKTYVIQKVRAVNVVRLHQSGFLEMRLQSHSNSTKYSADISRIWGIIQSILPNSIFAPFSLAKVKKELLGRRAELKKVVRFSDSTLRNSGGFTISASTGEMQTGDLFNDAGTGGSIDLFLKHGARCDSSNVWWLLDNGESRPIHCYFGGQDNEFAIPANCSRGEYEYVLNKIRSFSR